MDSVMPMAPAGSYFFYNPEQTTDARRHGNFVPQQMHIQQQQQQAGPANYYYAMPLTPAYSRPSSSSSQHQQPVLMSQQKQSSFPGSAMHYMLPATPRSVSVASNGKPAIMLETDFAVDVQPATPTLSSSTSSASSTIGSPSANETVLPTSMNPMFSCFDNSKDVAGDAMIEQYNAALACNSPPYTPVFIQTPSQPAQPAQTCGRATPTTLSSDLLTVSACPSLSSSPAPFAEQDNDFCDPRNLTFCGSEGSVSPTFSTVQVSAASPVADAEEDFLLSSESAVAPSTTEIIVAAPAPVNDFVSHGLPILEEFPELEGDDEFVNLVNLGAEFSHSSIVATPELSNRSRASSSVTTHSEPLEFFESWESSFESNVCEQQPSKRQRTSSGSFPIMSAASSFEVADASASAAGSPEQASETHNTSSNNNDSAMMSSSSEGSASPEADSCNMDGNGSSAPMPTNRRGRKQSLTEDPSKIFACDLCNRRFRRQEHLKRHYRSLHTQDKPFNCHECGKKFSRSDNLAQHARTHGAGALVMNVFDDPDLVAAANGGFMPHMMYQGQGMAMNDDYTTMGRVLFQVASEIPGSSSDHSDESDAQGKKKRKRME